MFALEGNAEFSVLYFPPLYSTVDLFVGFTQRKD